AFYIFTLFFFFSSRRRHTRSKRDWSSDVCSSDLSTWSGGTADPCRYPRNRMSSQEMFDRIQRPVTPMIAGVIAKRGGTPASISRSEERRVGKECGCRRSGKDYGRNR